VCSIATHNTEDAGIRMNKVTLNESGRLDQTNESMENRRTHILDLSKKKKTHRDYIKFQILKNNKRRKRIMKGTSLKHTNTLQPSDRNLREHQD
jgi:hypothetical protein